MRFLLFNLAVVAALAYLFSGGAPEVTELAHKAAAKTVEAGKSLAAKATAHVEEEADKPAPSLIDAGKPSGNEFVDRVQPNRNVATPPAAPKPLAPPPPVPAIDVAERTPQPVPNGGLATAQKVPLPADVQARRAEVLEQAAFESPAVDVAETVADRKRSLLKLAERMELFHLETLGR